MSDRAGILNEVRAEILADIYSDEQDNIGIQPDQWDRGYTAGLRCAVFILNDMIANAPPQGGAP